MNPGDISIPREVISYLPAYSGKAIKLYLWLLAQPGPIVSVYTARLRAKRELGFGRRETMSHKLQELALGHQECAAVSAPALIEIISKGRAYWGAWKIRILIPRRME